MANSTGNSLDKYELFRPYILAGDIILFEGTGTTSDLIKSYTKSKYSHVGLCLWNFDPAGTTERRLFLLESTTLNNVVDSDDGQYRKGVQMVLLSQRLEATDAQQAYWLPLKIPLTDAERVKGVSWAFQKWSSKTPYDYKQCVEAGLEDVKVPWLFKWLLAPVRQMVKVCPDDTRLFCSELVTKFFQECDRLPNTINSSLQTPEMVAEFDIWRNPPIPLLDS